MKKLIISLLIALNITAAKVVFAEDNFFVPQNPSGNTQLTVFYMNDMHGELTNFGRIYSAKKVFDEKNSRTNSLSSASGDIYIGKNKKLNLAITKLLNNLNLELFTLGNHEFDNGSQSLSEYLQNVQFKTVLTNAEIPEGNPLYKDLNSEKIVSSYVIEKNGEKFGVIGAAPIGVNLGQFDKENPINVYNPKETINALNSEIAKLKKQNINKIIFVSHLGYFGEGGDLNVAKQTSGIDIILGGHTHLAINGVQKKDVDKSHMTNLVYSKSKEPVIIVQTAGINKQVGYLDVLFDKNGKLIEKNIKNTLISPENFDSDKTTDKIVQKVLGKNKVVAHVEKPFVSSGTFEERNYENPTANLMTDAVAYKTKKAEVVLIQSPSVRGGLSGDITTYQVKYKMLPFNDKLYYIELSEKDFVSLLNKEALTSMTTSNSQMLQCSGMHYTVDKTIQNPKSPDAMCIKDIIIYNKKRNYIINPLAPDENKSVKCVVAGYLFVDKNTKDILANGKNKKLTGEEHKIMLKYLKRHKVINAQRQGRIIVIEK